MKIRDDAVEFPNRVNNPLVGSSPQRIFESEHQSETTCTNADTYRKQKVSDLPHILTPDFQLKFSPS